MLRYFFLHENVLRTDIILYRTKNIMFLTWTNLFTSIAGDLPKKEKWYK